MFTPITKRHPLGVVPGTLENWVARDRRQREGGDGRLSEDERAELARLRKENAELAMRCDVLKRSVALLMALAEDPQVCSAEFPTWLTLRVSGRLLFVACFRRRVASAW